MAERADAMHAIEFLNKRGANIKFSSVAEPPSESEWHTKGECFRPHVPIIHASRNVTSAPSYAGPYFRAGHNPATLRDCDFFSYSSWAWFISRLAPVKLCPLACRRLLAQQDLEVFRESKAGVMLCSQRGQTCARRL